MKYTMINFKLWIRAMRVPFFTATIIPVTLGAIVAWHDIDVFLWLKFLITMLGAVLIHAGTNLANDYFDHRWGSDEANLTPTRFSGGSRVIQEGLIAPKIILCVALFCFGLGSVIGLYLNYISWGNTILIIGIIGVFLGLFYTAKPLRIGYGSFGELAVGIGFGPLMVAGSYYVQAQILPMHVFLISIPIGILIALVLFINEFPDYESDKSVGKNTTVVILGKRNAVLLYHALLATVYLIILFLIIAQHLPPQCLIVFLSLPLAVKAIIVSKKNYEKIYELLPANAATIGVHFIIGLLLCAGIILDKIF